MDSKIIKDVVKRFLEDSDYKSILIDGPWGCGKTHIVNECIKNNKKRKIYYVSLFGLENIDEINTALYQSTKNYHSKFRRFIKKETIVLSKAIKAIPQISNLSDALEYQLDITSNKNVKSKSIIVFDDLERLSNKISYSDLLGYINSLFLSNCRFICLMSSKNIVTKERQDDFNDFKEKVFDSIYKINESNYEAMDEIFKTYNLELDTKLYNLFESNIRLAKKTELFFRDILKRFKDKGIAPDDVGFNKNTILKACIYSVKLVLKNYEEYPLNSDDKFFYQIRVQEYGKEITNGLFYLRNNEPSKSDFNLPRFNDIVLSLLNGYLFKNFEDFDFIMFSTFDKKDSDCILDKEFYYLSDENKKKYILEFENLLNGRDFIWDRKFVNIIRSIMLYGNYSFSGNQIDILVEVLHSQNTDYESDLKWKLGVFDDEKALEKYKDFFDKISVKLSELNVQNYIDKIDNYYETRNYCELSKLIDKLNICYNNEKQKVLNYIVSKDFLIPDISGDIDNNIWTYCHIMARFAKSNNVDDKFIEHAKNVCSNTTSECLIERYETLIFYNIQKTINLKNK